MSLTEMIAALSAPTDTAMIAMVVQRLPQESRATPPGILLDATRGVIGDRWSTTRTGPGGLLPPNPDAMVTLMRWDVAEVLARRAGVPTEILGDNLFATLDTSAQNLPPGTILRVGETRCVVTPKPHTGCSKFSKRVGADAWALTRADEWRTTQLRGVHLRVLEGGWAHVGDPISVASRP